MRSRTRCQPKSNDQCCLSGTRVPSVAQVELSGSVDMSELGVRVVTLTNGGADWIGRLLQRAKFDTYVERNLSVDEIHRWKPAPEVYLYAAERTGVSADRVALISAHAHDIDGARRAGLRTGR